MICLREFLRNDDGASMVEYATIVMMAAIFALAALRSLGTKDTNVLTNVGNQLS
jgi:Flp pilus assembly pilin Flp